MNKPIAGGEGGGYESCAWTSSPAGSGASHALAARPGHVHCVPAPGRRRLDMLVDTGLGLPDAAERWAEELAQAATARHDDLDHALPSRPRRRGGRRLASSQARRSRRGGSTTRSASSSGATRTGRAARRLVPRHGVPADVTAELIGQGDALPAVHPLPAGSRARRGGRPRRRLGGRRRAGHADGQLTLLKRRRARRRRPPARPDHADRRALAGEPARPARRLSRSRSSARSSSPRRSPSRPRRADRPTRSAARDELIAHHAERLAVTAAALGAEPRTGYEVSFPLFGDDLKPGGAPVRRRRDALPPRAPRARGPGRAARGRRRRYLYCRPQ